MRFYKDIIDQVAETAKNDVTKYHEWSPQSIEFYWNICTSNPLIRRLFYPMEYWEDLLAWAASKIKTTPRTIVDVGCGNGNLIERIGKIYKEATIYGVDLSEDAMRSVKKRFEKCMEAIQIQNAPGRNGQDLDFLGKCVAKLILCAL